MTYTPISGSVPQYQAADGTLASGYYLKFYSAGTTTPLSMATDSTGGTTLAKAQINTAGYPINGSGDVFIPHISQSYKIVLYKNATDADNDTTGNADWVIDNISQSASATPTQVINIEYQLGSEASGQVFTLADFTYALGVNNLLVYRNGNLLRQGVSNDYEETSASSVTINSSITIASTDQFAFVKGTSTTSTISDAASVTYTPAGSGAVATNVQAKLRETVSVTDFGAVGDGVVDDSSSIQAAIDYAQNSTASRAVLFPPGQYLISTSLSITAACTLYAESRPGPQVFAAGASQGGAQIVFNKSVSVVTDPDSYAIKVDTGAIGAEGFANVVIKNLGIGVTDPEAGGIYIEGASGVKILDNWIYMDKNNYTARTSAGYGIYCRDVIVSEITGNQFFDWAYSIVADDYFNENKIENNDFTHCIDKHIAIWGVTNISIRNTINNNNFIGDSPDNDTAIHLGGLVKATSICFNTFEIIQQNTILLDDTNPTTAASLSDGVKATTIIGNTFIACGGGLSNSRCVTFGANTEGGVVLGNQIQSASGPMDAMIGTGATDGNIFASANILDGKDLVAGDPTKVIDQTEIYTRLPYNASLPTVTGWDNDDRGRIFYNVGSGGNFNTVQVWNGTRLSQLKQCGTRTDTSQDATPEVRGLSVLFCNAATYTITDLDEGATGQTVVIYNQNAGNLNIDCTGTNLVSKSGSDIALTSNTWVKFENINGTTWVEI